MTLPGYFIDETQVTVARWKKFERATGHQSVFKETSRHFDVSENQSLPAGKITWEEAGVYSRWAGKSRPSEAQWEKAARGTDGRFYPWGNDAPTPEYAHTGTPQKRPALYTHVGRFARGTSPYGALDMIGNQYEWTSDWFESYPGNPMAEKMRDYGRVVSLRGGSWYHGWVGFYAAKRFCLNRGCVSSEAARSYAPDANINRADSENFPLIADKPGVELPEDKIILAVGATRFLTEDDRARIKAHPGCILLRRRDNVVLISGNPFTGLSGTSTAVTEFLNVSAQIRFYAPGELWHHRPAGGTFQIDKLDLFREQVFRTSFLAPYWKDHAEWLLMNQNGTRMTLQCFHNLASIFPPEKYGVSHPEIYEVRGGERRIPLNIGTRTWNPCLYAKALPEIAMDHIREKKMAQPALGYISLGMMDIPFECECPECKESVQKKRFLQPTLLYVCKRSGQTLPQRIRGTGHHLFLIRQCQATAQGPRFRAKRRREGRSQIVPVSGSQVLRSPKGGDSGFLKRQSRLVFSRLALCGCHSPKRPSPRRGFPPVGQTEPLPRCVL